MGWKKKVAVEIKKLICVKNNRVTDDIIICDKNKYYSHTLAEVMDGKHKNDYLLVTRSRIGK